MNEVEIEDREPWYRSGGETSRHLQVRCGDAYLLVRKSDGYTEIGYSDEEIYLPTATADSEIGDWVRIFQWRAAQTFPWRDLA